MEKPEPHRLAVRLRLALQRAQESLEGDARRAIRAEAQRLEKAILLLESGDLAMLPIARRRLRESSEDLLAIAWLPEAVHQAAREIVGDAPSSER